MVIEVSFFVNEYAPQVTLHVWPLALTGKFATHLQSGIQFDQRSKVGHGIATLIKYIRIGTLKSLVYGLGL